MARPPAKVVVATGAVERFLGLLFGRLGPRYVLLYLAFELGSALVISAGAVLLVALYVSPAPGEFSRALLLCWLFTVLSFLWSSVRMRRAAGALLAWIARDPGASVDEARDCSVTLPLDFLRCSGWGPVLLGVLPSVAVLAIELGLPLYSAVALTALALLAVGYAAILHFFATELALRPIVAELALAGAPSAATPAGAVSLRWRLLLALPTINVITGAVAAGLVGAGEASFRDAAPAVVISIAVAFLVSVGLSGLVAWSLLSPVRDLLLATERIRAGDLSARAAVASSGELARLAVSFNEMVAGLIDREALHRALSSYVAPTVAERVLTEGELLAGEEVEATVCFVDIRGFTAFVERATPREAVALVNRLLGLVVPILTAHGGHANKVIGDSVLGVFGVPERLADHADRAVAAAREIALTAEGEGLPLGIGLSSGTVLAGTVGEAGRLDFTVMGDPVNVAARVQELTRETGDTILLASSTNDALTPGSAPLARRGRFRIRGKALPVELYAVGMSAPAAAARGRAPS